MKGWVISITQAPETYLVRDSDQVLMPTTPLFKGWLGEYRQAYRIGPRTYYSSIPGAASVWRSKKTALRYLSRVQKMTTLQLKLKRVPIYDTGLFTKDGRKYLRMEG